ncbi:MAG: chaperone NapD [Caldilineaceae bacterium]
MIIKSYLAYPIAGQYTELAQELRSIAACEVVPATNRELLVVVTESPDEEAEKALVAQIERLPSLQALTLVSGHNETAERDE